MASKAFQYFAWGTPTNGVPENAFTSGIVDAQGNPTELYEPVCQINREIHALGTTLVKLDALEVYHSGKGITSPMTISPPGFSPRPRIMSSCP